MAKPKATRKSTPASTDSRALRLPEEPGKSPEQRLADIALDPTATGMATASVFSKGTFGDTDITALFQATRAAVDAVRAGDMAGPEALLVSQATSLNMIFTELARRAGLNMGEYLNASERYMRLALKAQAQCRSTIEALIALKNPPVVYAKQANISAGHQQINNHARPATAPRAENNAGAPNELLEAEHGAGERLDPRAAGAPTGGDPQMAAVGGVNRTENLRRQGAQQSER